MADLDADLQGGDIATESELHYDDHANLTADLQRLAGAFESELSFCTCEQQAVTPFIHTDGITVAAAYLDVEFTENVVLSGPALVVANWFVTVVNEPAREVTVGSVTIISPKVVRLAVTAQTLDGDYRLHLPQSGITSDEFGIFTGLYSLDFVGVPTVITVQMVRVVDTHHLDIIFAIPVSEETAGDPTNYVISNGLECTASVKITDQRYRIRNEPRQVDATTYTITITNIEPK